MHDRCNHQQRSNPTHLRLCSLRSSAGVSTRVNYPDCFRNADRRIVSTIGLLQHDAIVVFTGKRCSQKIEFWSAFRVLEAAAIFRLHFWRPHAKLSSTEFCFLPYIFRLLTYIGAYHHQHHYHHRFIESAHKEPSEKKKSISPTILPSVRCRTFLLGRNVSFRHSRLLKPERNSLPLFLILTLTLNSYHQ